MTSGPYGLCASPLHSTFQLALSPRFEVVAIALAPSIYEAAALSSLFVEVISSERSPARAGKLGQLTDVDFDTPTGLAASVIHFKAPLTRFTFHHRTFCTRFL